MKIKQITYSWWLRSIDDEYKNITAGVSDAGNVLGKYCYNEGGISVVCKL